MIFVLTCISIILVISMVGSNKLYSTQFVTKSLWCADMIVIAFYEHSLTKCMFKRRYIFQIPVL